MARLGIDVSDVAILRETEKSVVPEPVTAAIYAEMGGADGIVCTVQETLQPVTERDVQMLKEMVKTHLNLYLPPSEKAINLGLSVSPDMITLIPGKKPGSTPGGGLDVMGREAELSRIIQDIRAQNIVVSLLIEPVVHQIKSAAKIGADYVELHMGGYAAAADLNERADYIENISSLAVAASKLGLGVSASQKLDYYNVSDIAQIQQIEEINIGHAVMSRALWMGMEQAVRDMVALVH